eukprot:CAMPEP_0177653694 /NCGR_PEP_ID=MMETSP0447-20121125/13886_1 /TAXON_ID=0 /ORGANISM="Stygamoeba regulata, Strain BSH-02190019" /LENGTH=182 /DNA_ID=CAMNT_0019157195 /DNA_START=231 /DNA_END=775 /DNA_ORIENTATION=+
MVELLPSFYWQVTWKCATRPAISRLVGNNLTIECPSGELPFWAITVIDYLSMYRETKFEHAGLFRAQSLERLRVISATANYRHLPSLYVPLPYLRTGRLPHKKLMNGIATYKSGLQLFNYTGPVEVRAPVVACLPATQLSLCSLFVHAHDTQVCFGLVAGWSQGAASLRDSVRSRPPSLVSS